MAQFLDNDNDTDALALMDSACESRPAGERARWLIALSLAALVAALNFAAWRWLNPPLAAPDVPERVAGFAYNAFQRWDSPLERRYPSEQQIEADLRQLAGLTGRLRTYSGSEFPALPGIAERLGLKLSAGVWLDRRDDNNRREIDAVVNALREHRNIDRVIAGNETLLHGALTFEQLTGYLHQLRRLSPVPVSTAEPWHIWLKKPELALHVDFITVHLLPYWEGVPAADAVDYALQRLEQVQARFPGKQVVVGEIGWPSGGDAVGAARATPAEQAQFMRRFLAKVRGSGLDYYVMEAIDQPWKQATEGRVGAHWGWLDSGRQPKLTPRGPIEPDARWRHKAALSSGLGFVLLGAFLLAFGRMAPAGRVAFVIAAQALLSFAVALLALPMAQYLRPIDWALLALLLPALLLVAATLLAQLFEFAELFWSGSLTRRFEPRPLTAQAREPFVTIHLACCNEPSEQVIAAIDSLCALDYHAFEVLVISNNTRDEALWRPLQAHVATLPANIRFFHLDAWPGFKAGALNFALSQSDARAEVVAVVDADYVVSRDWLRSLLGHFDDPSVAIVQSPQAHRGWGRQLFSRLMNFEYDGFFRIGMHHRNERDAIIQHGTMTMIRAAALREHGHWSEWCLCEDSELGLRLLRHGWRSVYVDRVVGEGLTPDGFAAYKNQRRRWAQGAMQILKAHWRALFGAGPMTAGQRYHFVAGWLPWLGDALHLVFSFVAMAWTIGMLAAPRLFDAPTVPFVLPLAVLFTTRLVIGPLLYWRRVPCSPVEIGGAALAGLGLSHAVARGVIAGLLTRGGVFEVTRKGRPSVVAARFGAVREEAAMLLALVTCLAGLALGRGSDRAGVTPWLLLLGLQAMPYLAALACQALSRLPLLERRMRSTRPARSLPSRRLMLSAPVAAAGPMVGQVRRRFERAHRLRAERGGSGVEDRSPQPLRAPGL